MAHHTIPILFFVLVVVQLEQRFLLVQERKHDRKWYLPAGRVKLGESLVEAAKRETLEEAGIPIDVDGILQIDHTPSRDRFTRVRFIFVGHPVDNDVPPKSVHDDESLGARWVSLGELDSLPLRSHEVRELIGAVADEATIYPLSILTLEKILFEQVIACESIIYGGASRHGSCLGSKVCRHETIKEKLLLLL